jgi:F-type H+-transporting ATPase subunit delta
MNKNSGNSKVSLVYARALFNAAQEGYIIDKINADIKKATAFLESDNEALYKMLSSPIVELQDKKTILSNLFAKEVDTLLFNFFNLLVVKNRLDYVGSIFTIYSEMVDNNAGIVRGEVKISKMLDTDKRNKIIDSIQNVVNKKVEAEFIEDQDLVAGFSASVGSYRLEYSFDSHLKQIEKKLIRG